MTRALISIDAELKNLDLSQFHSLDHRPADSRSHERLLRRVAHRRFVELGKRDQAVKALDPLPRGPSEVLFGHMTAHFSAWHLTLAAIELIDQPISRMTVATLGFNARNCASLVELFDAGIVQNITLIVSAYFRSADPKVFATVRGELERRGQRIAVTRSHAKIVCLEASERHIVIEGSANLRSSENSEQFIVTDCAEVLTFHRTWLEGLIDADGVEDHPS